MTLDAESIADRVLLVRNELGLSQKAMAEKLGISYRSWQGLEGGRNVPSGETLLQFKEVGINPGWVLTGLGPKLVNDFPRAENTETAVINPSIYKAIKKVLLETNSAFGIRLSDEARDDEAARWYNQLVAMATGNTDEGKLRSLMPALQYDINEAVKSAAAEPGSGKRSAS